MSPRLVATSSCVRPPLVLSRPIHWLDPTVATLTYLALPSCRAPNAWVPHMRHTHRIAHSPRSLPSVYIHSLTDSARRSQAIEVHFALPFSGLAI